MGLNGKSWSLVLQLQDPKEGASVHTDSVGVLSLCLTYIIPPFQKQELSSSSLNSSGTLYFTRALGTLDLGLWVTVHSLAPSSPPPGR